MLGLDASGAKEGPTTMSRSSHLPPSNSFWIALLTAPQSILLMENLRLGNSKESSIDKKLKNFSNSIVSAAT
jgi:hypothetical protein